MIQDWEPGTLHLPSAPVEPEALAALWRDCTVNRIAVAAVLAVSFFFIRDFLALMPHLIYCCRYYRGSILLEHSVSMSATRNSSFAICFVAASLVADRFRLYDPAFASDFPYGLSLAVTAGALLLFLLLRIIIHLLVRPRRMNSEERAALRTGLYNFAILLTLIWLLTAGLGAVLHFPDTVTIAVLKAAAAVVYLLFFVRSAQILGSHCNGLATFLYLCALEIVPAGLLVASAALF